MRPTSQPTKPSQPVSQPTRHPTIVKPTRRQQKNHLLPSPPTQNPTTSQNHFTPRQLARLLARRAPLRGERGHVARPRRVARLGGLTLVGRLVSSGCLSSRESKPPRSPGEKNLVEPRPARLVGEVQGQHLPVGGAVPKPRGGFHGRHPGAHLCESASPGGEEKTTGNGEP